jgi:hypothetical protein
MEVRIYTEQIKAKILDCTQDSGFLFGVKLQATLLQLRCGILPTKATTKL